MVATCRPRKSLAISAVLLANRALEAGVMFNFNPLNGGINATNSTSSPGDIDQYMTSA